MGQLVKPDSQNMVCKISDGGQWEKEIERQSANNKSTEEEKYVDLLESQKKIDKIYEYVNRTLK